MSTAPSASLTRLQPVLAYIEHQLDAPLSLTALAAKAALSPFHFHRVFRAVFGINVHQYVQLLRLQRASYQLAFRSDQSITDIGLACGYQNSESFSRAFRQWSGQSPTAFRTAPDWLTWHELQQPLTTASLHRMQTIKPVAASNKISPSHNRPAPEPKQTSVRIGDFPATRVAVLEHRGDPRRLGDSIRRFIAWRKANQLPPTKSATFNILYDDPELVPASEFRFDLCAAIAAPLAENADGIVEKWLPAGRCAVLRHVGSDETLASTIHALYHDWLPASGEQPGEFPLFLQRVKFFPDVPAHEATVDVFLPLA
ncbi:MAG: AraC family transcriptional regulator [Pseudomonadota bacterium]